MMHEQAAHDGILDTAGQVHVHFDAEVPFESGCVHIQHELANSGVSLCADEALALLAWLQAQAAVLRPLARAHAGESAQQLTFPCATCGTVLRLVRRTKAVLVAGTFCPTCDEQYYTRWDGTVHQGTFVSEENSTQEQAR